MSNKKKSKFKTIVDTKGCTQKNMAQTGHQGPSVYIQKMDRKLSSVCLFVCLFFAPEHDSEKRAVCLVSG